MNEEKRNEEKKQKESTKWRGKIFWYVEEIDVKNGIM